MIDKSITEMLAPTTADPDATLTPIEVFGEKSQDADNLKGEVLARLSSFLFGPESGVSMGYPPDIALSPFVSGKGIMATLKNLLGKAKSKAKFPVGYGEPTRNIAKERANLKNYFEVGKLQDALHRLADPEKFSRLNRLGLEKPYKETLDIMELQKALSKGRPIKELTKGEYNEIWKTLNKISSKPKGMRQFGKFNRQKWEK